MDESDGDDFFWESLISPGQKNKKKKKGKTKTETKCPKQKKSKTEDGKKKKKTKKKSASKDAAEGGKKKKSSVVLEDSLVFTQDHCRTQPEPEPSVHQLQNSQTKTRRKKKVAFALSDFIPIKRPKFTSSTPKDTAAPETPRFHANCSQILASNGPAQNQDSPSSGEDVNSQDLFITQKKFRTSPVETLSGEVLLMKSPTPPDRKPSSPPAPKPEPAQNHKAPAELLKEDEMFYLKPKPCKRDRLQRKPLRVPSPPKFWSSSSSQPVPSSCPSENSPPRRVTSVSTQTENFFTTELSSYLGFCESSRVSETVQPLDLSLPHRVRNNLRPRKTTSLKVPDPLFSSSSSDVKVKTEKQSSSVAAQKKTTGTYEQNREQSPQVDSQLKFSDTTSSSEDVESGNKLDLMQVRSVQMRLNESFFFKSKGDGLLHRPASPLMKLAQGQEPTKTKKGR